MDAVHLLFSNMHMRSVEFLEDLKRYFPKSLKRRLISPSSSQDSPSCSQVSPSSSQEGASSTSVITSPRTSERQKSSQQLASPVKRVRASSSAILPPQSQSAGSPSLLPVVTLPHSRSRTRVRVQVVLACLTVHISRAPRMQTMKTPNCERACSSWKHYWRAGPQVRFVCTPSQSATFTSLPVVSILCFVCKILCKVRLIIACIVQVDAFIVCAVSC